MRNLFLPLVRCSLSLLPSLMGGAGGGLLAQSNMGTLSFFIRSSENYYGVKSSLQIKGSGETFFYETNEGGHFVFSAKEGRYDVRAEAIGFHSIQTYFVIEPGKNLDVEIFLDPANKKPSEPVQYSTAVIDGFVVDYSTGMPMKNAAVLMDEKEVAVTDEKGSFSFSSDEYSNIQSPGNKAVRKTFRFSSPGYSSFVFEDVLFVPTKITLKVTLKKGNGTETQKNFQHVLDNTYGETQSNPPSLREGQGMGSSSVGCTIPSSIRVGTGCSCTTCSGVQVMSLQYYAESGLDDEWIASWLSASLEAGSIPYRSYGAWYVNNPVDPNFDIASSTCNQVWDGTDVYTSTQTAAQVTSGLVLTADGINPVRSEYSAENNQGGTSYNCSDCYAGGSGAYSCYSDNICCGTTPAGHGRGMCQWGSQRWAQNGQNYQWIVNHYYIATVGYSLCSPSAPPSNDGCASASALSSNAICINTQGDLNGATSSGLAQASCDGFSNPALLDVWYNFTAVASTHTLSITPSSAMDPVLILYTSCSGGEISCADAGGPGAGESIIASSLTVGNTYYIRVYDYGSIAPSTTTFDICVTHTQVAPSNLNVTSMGCPNDGVTLSWQNSGANWFVDISDDQNFSYFWNKAVPNLTSTICPGSFCLFSSPCNPSDYLAFQPLTTYYWRVWDGTSQTYGNSFTTPWCVYTNTSCSGTFDDTGGPSNPYSGNEDYTTVIQPLNASSVTMTFTSFDIEQDYDSLWIYNGPPASAILMGGYTGTNSPGTVTANSGVMTLRFKSDPFVDNAGWTANWSCVTITDVNEVQISDFKFQVFPNPFSSSTTIYYQLPTDNSVEIKLMDVVGREILLYENKNESAGAHIFPFNAKEFIFAKGLHLLKFISGNNLATLKLINIQ